MDGEPSSDDSRRLKRRKFVLIVVGAMLISFGIMGIIHLPLYFIKLRSPHFQVDSVYISVDDNNVAKWNISFSVSNPNYATLRYRKIEVAFGRRRPLNSTAARITPLFKQRHYDRSSRDATVYVALPSPRPALIVDGLEFDIRFLSEYVSTTGKKGTTVAVCGDNHVEVWPSNGEVAMVGPPMLCH